MIKKIKLIESNLKYKNTFNYKTEMKGKLHEMSVNNEGCFADQMAG